MLLNVIVVKHDVFHSLINYLFFLFKHVNDKKIALNEKLMFEEEDRKNLWECCYSKNHFYFVGEQNI